jgi:Mrp family chromosome partitioning ATPase
VQLFNSATRIRKEERAGSSTREPQGVQFLMARIQSAVTRRTGGAIVAFTSANPGEGVSYVVQFFAEKLASQTGKPTLVVNAERLESLRATDLMDMPETRTKVERFWSGPNGNGNGNGNGTDHSLEHEKLRELESETGLGLLHALRASLGYTLIDCPSIATSYEAAMLAPDVDGMVLVVAADRTKRDQIFRARQTIEMAKGNLMGLVLNRRRHVVPEWFYRRL